MFSKSTRNDKVSDSFLRHIGEQIGGIHCKHDGEESHATKREMNPFLPQKKNCGWVCMQTSNNMMNIESILVGVPFGVFTHSQSNIEFSLRGNVESHASWTSLILTSGRLGSWP